MHSSRIHKIIRFPGQQLTVYFVCASLVRYKEPFLETTRGFCSLGSIFFHLVSIDTLRFLRPERLRKRKFLNTEYCSRNLVSFWRENVMAASLDLRLN